MKRLIISILLLTGIATALWFLKNHDSRLPSSLPHTKESGDTRIVINDRPLSGEIKKQIKKAILFSWDWYFKSQTLYINFENLKLVSAEKTYDLCELYPTMTLVLEAPNVTYNGEHPEISFTKPCTSPEIGSNQLTATNSRPVNLEFDLSFLIDPEAIAKIDQLSSETKTNLRFQNWDSEVSLRWRVKQLLFYPVAEHLGSPIDLVKYEILGYLKYSVEFELSEKKQ